MKTKIHSLIIEGIVFCGSGLLLLSYSLTSYNKAFNKEWGQSPYLFPLLVAAALIGLSVWLMMEGVRAMKKTGKTEMLLTEELPAASPAQLPQDSPEAEQQEAGQETKPMQAGPGAVVSRSKKIRGVVIALVLCVLYYMALAFLKIPYITVGILSFQYTFSTFEIVTLVFLGAMMGYMGVRKPLILTLVPLGTTLFLSIAFRTLLHVLLP